MRVFSIAITCTLCVVWFFLGRALADGLAPNPDDAAGLLTYAYDAATSGRWKVFAGAVVLLATLGVRKSPVGAWVPWLQSRLGGFVLAFALALGGTYGLALATGADLDPKLALDAFVTTGLAAGLWQWLQLQLAQRSEAS